MGLFEKNLIEKFGKENFKKIQSVSIGIAGAGGLGSNCALNLVRSGFKKFTIVDFDKVTPSNLDRQFYFLDQIGMPKIEALKINLLRVNPGLKLVLINKKIERPSDIENLFGKNDIIVECLDSPEYKSMLVGELLRLKKMVVAASGIAGIGSSDRIKVNRLKKNLIIIGDLESDTAKSLSVSPRVNIAAAKQADSVLDIVIKQPRRED